MYSHGVQCDGSEGIPDPDGKKLVGMTRPGLDMKRYALVANSL